MGSLVSVIVAVLQVIAAMMGEIIKRKQEAERAESRQAIISAPFDEFRKRFGVLRDMQNGVPGPAEAKTTTTEPGEPVAK